MKSELDGLSLEILRIIESWGDVWYNKEVKEATRKLKHQGYLRLGALLCEDRAGYFGRGYFLTGLGHRAIP